MENRTTILNELKEVSQVVANIGLQNPYQVPQGYFEAVPGQLLKKVKGQIYEVPEGYFETLPETLLNRVKTDHVDDELETLSPLLKQIGKKNPFSLPEGYFSDLSENAVAGAQALDFVQEELSSPLLGSLKNKQVYEVPTGYFDQLPAQLLNKVQPRQPGKVISMRKRVIQYAAAAVIAGVVIMAGWMYFGNATTTTNGDVPPVVASNLEKISDEVLESYIENESILPVAENTVTARNEEMDSNDMKEMLADVSDEDLQQYIEKFNTAKDIITN